MGNAFTSLLLILILVGHAAPLRADLLLPVNFSLFATHPDASDPFNQPTERGRTIRDIYHYEGKLYTGYGDWTSDTGPINVRSLDVNSGVFSNPLVSVNTEAISHFRGLNGSLYTTTVDPLGIGPQPAGYAVGNSSHSWSYIAPTISGTSDTLTATHIFDINQTSNGDIFMAGSRGTFGAIWRSVDGGATFTIDSVPFAEPSAPANNAGTPFSRYVGVGILNDQVFVQRVDYNVSGANQNNVALKYDGNSWQTVAVDLIQEDYGYVTRPEQFGNEMLYLSSDLSDGFLYRFDGTNAQHALNGVVRDFQVLSGSVVALMGDGEMLFSSDLNSWSSLGHAPGSARSLEIVGDTIFVGTTDGRIFSASGFGSLTGVPEPGAALTVLSLIAGWGLTHRRRVLN
ncbi:MAG: hypothetical protein NXI32_16620 [bacterium]|nr:hypothetical protein [bacterium]